VRFAKGHKEETRQRIIEVASRMFRRDGVEAVGIAGLMAEAGLTHGGFYAHFRSKEELVREAMLSAFEHSRLRRETKLGQAGLEELIRNYLRPAHRDAPERGCAAAALVSEIARHETATREVFSEKLETLTARIAGLLPESLPEAERRATATAVFGMMLGTLQMARAVTDPVRSDAILESGIAAALRLTLSEMSSPAK
jgi:TetR/AcrR family transcriptional regulator, transcriptional repressor for nem operon